MLVPGRGKGGECPGTRAGQAKGLTAGDAAAVTARTPTGCPALKAICGWSITPTRMANAPTALSAKVAAWANVVFMGQPSCSRCSGTPSCQFVKSYAGAVPIGHKRGKAAHYAPMSAPASICLANEREILPMIGNGAGNAVYRPVGGLSGRGRARKPGRRAGPPGARHRRARYRQGTDRRTPPPPVGALGQALSDHELRRDARDADRIGTVRARGGCFHGRNAQPRRALRGGGRRDIVPR